MIRNTFLKEITETLSKNNRFESSDFKLQNTTNTKGTTLRINYIILPKFYITFLIPNSKTGDGYDSFYAFTGNVCPGPISYEESFSFKQQNEIFTRIQNWQITIWEELSANPAVKLIESHQKEINEILEKVDAISEELFSKEEANKMRSRLDDLEKTLAEHIENSSKDKDELKKEIDKLHDDISTLKETVDFFNKKGWFKSFTSKIFKWTKDSDNRKMIGDGYKLLKEFLPENINNSLP